MQKIRTDAANLKAAIRGNYDAFAPRYDWVLGAVEWFGVSRLRRRLLSRARGKVLEIAVGTGKNLPHYPPGCRIHAIDFSPGMLGIAERRAARSGLAVQFRLMDAERLAFRDAAFDSVVCTLATCTFTDPVTALAEMGRVARTDGQILLLEHGYSDRGWLRRFQDWRADKQFEWLGCRWDREPHELATRAGLRVDMHIRTFFGVMHSMSLRPGVR